MSESPEYQSLLYCTSGLTDLLQHNLSVSGKLLEKGLVTRDVRDWIQTAQGVSNKGKAGRLVSCVTDSIKESAERFHVLIGILKEDSFFDDIVEKIDEHRKCAESRQAIPGTRGKEEVGSTIKTLEKQFASLQRRLSSELCTRSDVSTEVLLESLTLLPIALRNEYQTFILENLQTLERADSIRKIFHHLNPHLTFIDYGLLEHLIDDFGSKELKDDMSQYVVAVQIFIDETTVQELMDHWPGQREIPPHFEELRAVIDEDPSRCTLRQLDSLRKKFCNVTRLSETVLILIGVKRRSSFLLKWIIPSIFLPHLKSEIWKLSSFFQVEQVYSLTVSEQRLYSIADEYEMRLLMLCGKGNGDKGEVLYLLSQPEINPNIYDESGRTSLWYASSYGRTDLVRILLEHGADLDLPTDDEFGDTALMEACDAGHVDTAALLIDKGARVDYKNKLGQHSLYFASYDGGLDIVRLLLQRGAQIDLPTDDDYGFTALGIACQEGRREVAGFLIDRGATVNYRNKLGATPLYMASQCDHCDIVQLLLDCGANVNEQTETGWTPLLDATDEGHTEVVELLIKNGAKLDTKNKEGRTALSLAKWRGHTDIARLLIEQGASTNIHDQVHSKTSCHDDVIGSIDLALQTSDQICKL